MRIAHKTGIDGLDMRDTKRYVEKYINRYQNKWDPYQNRKDASCYLSVPPCTFFNCRNTLFF